MAKYLTFSNNQNLKVIAKHEIEKPEQKFIIKLKNNFLQQNKVENQIDEKKQPDNLGTKIAKKAQGKYWKKLEERPRS